MPDSVSTIELFTDVAVLASTVMPSASVPDMDHPCALVSCTVSGSLNVTVILSGAVASAVTVGARPSDIGMFWRDSIRLSDGSAMEPPPEPGSPDRSMLSVLYRSTALSGLVSSRFPERVSTIESESDACVLASTVRPSASVPDMDHPCALSSVIVRSSLNVTVISLGAVASAVTVGFMPSPAAVAA